MVDMAQMGKDAWRGAREDGDYENLRAVVNGVFAEPWRDEYRGLSESSLKRVTYSLGARGKEDQGELDARTLFITVGVDTSKRGIFAEWVGWGLDPATLQVVTWGLQYEIIGSAG